MAADKGSGQAEAAHVSGGSERVTAQPGKSGRKPLVLLLTLTILGTVCQLDARAGRADLLRLFQPEQGQL